MCIKSKVPKQEKKHKTLWKNFSALARVWTWDFRVVPQCINYYINRTMTNVTSTIQQQSYFARKGLYFKKDDNIKVLNAQ